MLAAFAALAVAPLIAFTGLDSSQLPGVNPADVQIAVGPTAVVELVNSSGGFFARTGGPAAGTLSLGELFTSAAVNRSQDETTDPRVLFDPPTQRFFGAMFDITRSETTFGVTTTADPTSQRTTFGIGSSGCPDQPRLGLSTTVVVLTDDLFSSCQSRGRFVGGELTILSKQDLLNGVTPAASHFGPNNAYEAITPAVALTPTPALWLVSLGDDGKSIGVLTIASPNVASIPIRTVKLARPVAEPPPAPQRGSNVPVDTGDPRVQNAYLQGTTVWLTLTAACAADAARSCGRVIAIDTTKLQVTADATIALPSGRSYFYPAVAPDSRGNAVVGFEYSSPADFPSLAWTYVRPDGVAAAATDVVAGSAPNESGRFGDYSGAAVDPLDPSHVWIAGEIGAAVGGNTLGWSTGIAEVAVPPQRPALVGVSTARGGIVHATLYPEGSRTTYRVTGGVAHTVAGSVRPVNVMLHVKGPKRVRLVATNVVGTTQSRLLAVPR